MAILDPLPKSLAESLSAEPQPGNRNIWLFTVAKRARHHASPEKIRTFLQRVAANWTDRDFHPEIDRAITRAFESPDQPSSFNPQPSSFPQLPPWPPFNPDAWTRRISHPPLFNLDPLEISPEQILDTLYPTNLVTQAFLPVPPTLQSKILPSEATHLPADRRRITNPKSKIPSGPLLCLAADVRTAQTQPREHWRGQESTMQFIVANPMTALTGITQSGKTSQRCHDNATRNRRFQVIEFDRGTLREQSAILSSLQSDQTPLILVVWSGGKSLHGWYDVNRLSQYAKLRFFRHAVFLGADSSLWDPAKLVRMPGGRRENGTRQNVLHFSPENLA